MDSIRHSSQRIPRPAHHRTLDFAQLQPLKASDLSPENGSFKVDGKNPGSCTILSQDLRTGKAGLEWGHIVQKEFFLHSPRQSVFEHPKYWEVTTGNI